MYIVPEVGFGFVILRLTTLTFCSCNGLIGIAYGDLQCDACFDNENDKVKARNLLPGEISLSIPLRVEISKDAYQVVVGSKG